MKLLSSSGGSNLFASEYLSEHPEEEGATFIVSSVELASSNKGYFLRTDGFSAWIFKNSAEAKTLLPLLEKWSSPKAKNGFAVVIQLSSQVPKTNCLIGLDETMPTTWVKSSLVDVFTATPVT